MGQSSTKRSTICPIFQKCKKVLVRKNIVRALYKNHTPSMNMSATLAKQIYPENVSNKAKRIRKSKKIILYQEELGPKIKTYQYPYSNP